MATIAPPPPKRAFNIYIDESGDEGFCFEKGASRWFILSGVVVPVDQELGIVAEVAKARATMGLKPNQPIHFRKLNHEKCLFLADHVSKLPVRTASVLMHKPDLHSPENFRERHRLYRYACRFLLERASWYCRDHVHNRMGLGCKAGVVFSNRSGMSYDEIREYIDLLYVTRDVNDVRICWDAIDATRIETYNHGQRALLQVADVVASALFQALEPGPLGYREDRYARMLQSVAYRRGGVRGYGLKFFPSKTEQATGCDPEYAWCREVYGFATTEKNAGPGS